MRLRHPRVWMYDEWFADGRPEVSELTANLAGNIRLDSKQTGDWVLQAQRQKLVEHGGCFCGESSFRSFCQVMAHNFQHTVCVAPSRGPDRVGCTFWRL